MAPTPSHDPHDPTEMARLGAQFADLSALLAHESDGTLAPDRVTTLAAKSVPHAQLSGLTFVRRQRRPETIAATDDLAVQVDRIQYDTREGPCLEAAADHDVVVTGDLATEPRWPAFGPRCAQKGIHSMMSVRLSLGGEDRAALNFYAPGPDQFDDLDVGTASIFAPFAALAVQQHVHDRDLTNFGVALTTSRQIGTAVGILMSRHRIDADVAFDLLRGASQHLNRKLRDIAEEVESTGELPATRRRRGRAR